MPISFSFDLAFDLTFSFTLSNTIIFIFDAIATYVTFIVIDLNIFFYYRKVVIAVIL